MEYTEEQKADIQKQIDEAKKEATKGFLSQEQFDKALSKRIGEIQSKHEAEIKEKEETAKMDASTKMKHDMEKLQKALKEKDDILKQKEHHEGIRNLMAEKNIGKDFFDMFVGLQDMEKAGVMMDKFNETTKSEVDKAVDSKINPHVPKTGVDPGKNGFSSESTKHSFNQFK
jgi:hypothetical protein